MVENPDRGQPDDRKVVASLVIEHAAVVLTLLGLLAYAIARATADGFYGQLSIVPEEVGVTYASVLSRAALYLGLVALIFIAAEPSVGKAHTRRSALGTAGGACLGALLVFTLVLGTQLPLLRLTYLFLAVWLGSIGYAVYKLALTRARGPGRGFYSTTLSHMAWIGLLTLVLMLSVGRDLANAAGNGVPFGPNSLQLFSIRADVVCLRATDGPLPGGRVGPFVYLGEAQGTMVLLDYRSDDPNIIRLPSSGVMTEFATPSKDQGFFDRRTWTCPRSRGFGTQTRTASTTNATARVRRRAGRRAERPGAATPRPRVSLR